MPEVLALKSFKGRYGQIRAGQQFNAEPGYAAQLKRNKLITFLGEADEPGPTKNRDKGDAPGRGGKEGQGKGNPAKPTDPQPSDDGQAITSASVQAARVSPKKTLPKSAVGGRRGTPTPRASDKKKTPSTPTEDAAE